MWNTKIQLNNLNVKVNNLQTEVNDLVLSKGVQNPLVMDIDGNNQNITNLNALTADSLTGNTIYAQTYEVVSGGNGFNNITINNSTGNTNTWINNTFTYGVLNEVGLNDCVLNSDLNTQGYNLNNVGNITADDLTSTQNFTANNANITNLEASLNNCNLSSDLDASNNNIINVNNITANQLNASGSITLGGNFNAEQYITLTNTGNSLAQLHLFNAPNGSSHQIVPLTTGELVSQYYPDTTGAGAFNELVFAPTSVSFGNNKSQAPLVQVMGCDSQNNEIYGQVYDTKFNRPLIEQILIDRNDAGGQSITNLNEITAQQINCSNFNPPITGVNQTLAQTLSNGNDANNIDIFNAKSLTSNTTLNINGYIQANNSCILGTKGGRPTLIMANGTGSNTNKYTMFVYGMGENNAGDLALINNIGTAGSCNVFTCDNESQNIKIGNDRSPSSVWINGGSNGSTLYKGLVLDSYSNPYQYVLPFNSSESNVGMTMQDGQYKALTIMSVSDYFSLADYNGSSAPTFAKVDFYNFSFSYDINPAPVGGKSIVLQFYLSDNSNSYIQEQGNCLTVINTNPTATNNTYTFSGMQTLYFQNTGTPFTSLYLMVSIGAISSETYDISWGFLSLGGVSFISRPAFGAGSWNLP